MTKPDPVWNLMKAAESALIRMDDAQNVLRATQRTALADECYYAAQYLREAITAYKEATGQPYNHITAKLNGEWERFPERDKRMHRGNDYAGDAWRNKSTGQIHWVSVNHVPSFAREKIGGEE